jgi:hypothetical protein
VALSQQARTVPPNCSAQICAQKPQLMFICGHGLPVFMVAPSHTQQLLCAAGTAAKLVNAMIAVTCNATHRDREQRAVRPRRIVRSLLNFIASLLSTATRATGSIPIDRLPAALPPTRLRPLRQFTVMDPT